MNTEKKLDQHPRLWKDLRHLNKEELQEARQARLNMLKLSKRGLTELTKILTSWIEELEPETSMSDYDSPSWSFKDADLRGQRRILKTLKEMINDPNITG